MSVTFWVVLIGWPTLSAVAALFLGRFLQACEDGAK